jgi:hypothetical protein
MLRSRILEATGAALYTLAVTLITLTLALAAAGLFYLGATL